MSHFANLKKFIDSSPTSLFCAYTMAQHLEKNGYKLFEFHKDAPLPIGEKIYLRHKGLIGAFCLPKTLKKAKYLLAHTDSPCLKLKPHPLIKAFGMNFLACEPYGSPLLSSYLGKPLRLAGQIALDTPHGIELKNVALSRTFIIPDPAIHLSKEANAALDKGKLHALVSINEDLTLGQLLEIEGKILGHDLYLTLDEPLVEIGSSQKLFAGPRLDNLSSCYALLETLTNLKCSSDTLYGALFFDHEEIGSETFDGAKSHFFKKRIKKIIDSYHTESMIDVKSQAYSLDVAHANHPSYPEKFDIEHPILLGGGLVLKHHSQHKYAQDLELFAMAKKLCPKTQTFTMRNEVGTGSTLGPYFSSLFSIATQDVGIPLLGMHSTTEIIAEEDLKNLVDFAKGFYHGL